MNVGIAAATIIIFVTQLIHFMSSFDLFRDTYEVLKLKKASHASPDGQRT
jgi:hypothetical protein